MGVRERRVRTRAPTCRANRFRCSALGRPSSQRRQVIAFETLTYEVADGVALITLNRPARLNAVNSVMSRELPEVWRRFADDPSAVAAIVTGAGDRAFCTGADVADLPRMITDDEGRPLAESIRWSPLQNAVWKPVICAVNGLVMGGGLHFVAESDVVIASDDAEISDPHVSVGLVSALETVALARRIPIGSVLRLALGGRGESMSARRAYEIGLFDHVCPAGELLDHARALAGRMCRNSPGAMARTKRAIWGAKDFGLGEATQRAWDEIVAHYGSPDFVEGVRAFNEGRDPVWDTRAPATPA